MAGRNVDHNLTAEYVRSVLDYDPVTGFLIWRVRSDVPSHINQRDAGKRAGFIHRACTGHLKVILNGAGYFYHRLVWLHFYGCWPKQIIDHIDGNPGNNAIENLREASFVENSRNQKATKSSGNRLKGARFHKGSGRWQASICADGKSIYLGLFDTPEAAHEAYCRKATELFGEFARFA